VTSSNLSAVLQAAVASHKAGDLQSAVNGYRRVLAESPDHPDALNLCGVALSQSGDFEAAIPLLLKVLEQRPDFADAAFNLGVAYQHMGAYEESARVLKRVLDINPNHLKATWTYASVCHEVGEVKAAAQAFEKALSQQPASDPIRYQAGLFYLTCEDWKAGWQNYDARFEVIEAAKSARRAEPPPYWNGQPLEGCSLLAWTEQGLGEEVLAVSALANIVSDSVDVTLECSRRMVPIVQRSLPNVRVVSWDEHAEAISDRTEFDFQVPALELTSTWLEHLDDAVSSRSVIEPDAELKRSLRQKYETFADGRRIVGLSWFSRNKDFGARKSLPLADLAAAVNGEHIFFVSLQYGDHAQEVAELAKMSGIDVYIDSDIDAVADLDAAFAQCAAMDVIVTTSNSVAHMGGAMGVETWVLLSTGFASPWFWLRERPDSPWYPSVKLVRAQNPTKADNDWWLGPLTQLRSILQGLAD